MPIEHPTKQEMMLWGFTAAMLAITSVLMLMPPVTMWDVLLGLSPLLMILIFGVSLWRARRKRNSSDTPDPS